MNPVQCLEKCIHIIRNEDVELQFVSNSYNQLLSVRDELRKFFSNNKLSFEVKGWGVRNTTNKVNVYIEELTVDKISEFKKEVLDSNVIQFVNLPKERVCQSEMVCQEGSNQQSVNNFTLNSGARINTTKYGMSIGFPAKYKTSGGSYQYGFVTAGHSANKGENIYTVSGALAGSVTKQVYSSSSGCDFSFVRLNSGVSMERNVSSAFGGSGTINNYYVTPIEGKIIYKTGYETGTTYGEVYHTTMDYTAYFDGSSVNLKDLIMFHATAQRGDSGGIVYFKYNGTNTPVGIVAAEYLNGAGVLAVKAENMVTYGVYPD